MNKKSRLFYYVYNSLTMKQKPDTQTPLILIF
jgi:hypothetical protein